ncbi:DNA repair-scaffolding protein-like isoform X2 [Schistocerca americana]|uniref:DNA repair-scaffolding protein-like isoform X2 n=1 Tax=Schistocerca americana TaxID=7009 RepID=UPI001F4FADC1|nr:DNA repair-scaffolding protein-like isoform X2 [Schistocerca americana]
MCMSHFEVISIRPEKSLAAIQNESKEVLINEEEFTCQCLTGTQNEGQLCQFRLPRNIFRIFFNEKDQEDGRCESHFSGGASSNSKGTIAEALAGSSFLISGGIELCITVVGVFCYRSSGLWTLLHVRKTPSFCKLFCKTNGQTPELTIRFETDANTNDNGSLNISTDTTNNQSILYTFSPLSEEWSCTSMETETISLLVDSFQYITDILRKVTEDMQERCSIIIKLIYVHENLFYCTDTSLNITNCAEDHSSYVIIKVLSTCVVPQEAVKGNITVLCLLNVLLSEGKLIADKYTRILTVPGKDADAPVFGLPFKFPDDFLESIAAQKTLIKNFSKMSKVLDLVKVSGCVIGVDEDTAFSWPTCEICGSDFLSEIDGGGFYCEKCNQETETITAMSLEVNISCVEVSEESKVKIKLLQKSIANLLPPEPSGSEGYDVLSVLGKYIGPITCLVVKVNEVLSVKSYHLDEVLLFENI